MLDALKIILRDNWQWRRQIGHLALFDLVKKSRGAVLSWSWFFIKPGIYIFCFWFALEIGLRAGRTIDGEPPYFLWLCAGLIPWFFMQEMLGSGIDVLHRYPYLVNKVRFPLSGISTIFTSATMIVQIMLLLVLFVIYLICGMSFDVYLMQIPILLALMFIFWNIVSIFFSQLCALSKDVTNLMKALSTPFFWLSGILFNVDNVPVGWVQLLFKINPITFFVTAFRDAFYDKAWFWEDAWSCAGFALVFALTLTMALFAYARFSEEVPDVL